MSATPNPVTAGCLSAAPRPTARLGYSPDGTRVAFLRDAGCCPKTVDIFAVKADGSDLHKATSSPLATSAWANWAPDSRHLGIIEYNADGEDGQLYLLDTEGREAPLLLAPDMDVRDAMAFRPPNGDQIAFRALVNGKFGVYAINADGTGDLRTLLEPDVSLDMGNHAANMVYSADGQQLFYQSYTPATDGRTEGCCQLWVMNADGSDPHAFESVNEGAWTGVPTVSPDGRWVSYWSVLGNSGRQQIRVAPADGSGPAIGTGPAMSDFFPWAWAPDSSKILMMPDDGSTTSAYLIDPEGGPWSTVPFEIWLGPRLAAPGALSLHLHLALEPGCSLSGSVRRSPSRSCHRAWVEFRHERFRLLPACQDAGPEPGTPRPY